MRFRRIVQCSLLLFCGMTVILGQTTDHFERYTMEDGLSDHSVNDILQTRDGFLWVATVDGLNRFDGKAFTVFRNDPNDSTSLSESNINRLFEDSRGDLWVGTWGGGLCRFDRRTNRCTVYRHDPDDSASLASNNVQCITEDSQGRLLVGTQPGGLNVLDAGRSSFTHRYQWTDVFSVTEHPKGTLWVGTSGSGLISMTMALDQRFVIQYTPTNPYGLESNTILSITPLDDSLLLLGMSDGVGLFNINSRSGNSFYPELFRHRDLRAVLYQTGGRLWIGSNSYSGLYEFRHEGTAYRLNKRHVAIADDHHTLLSDHITAVMEDRAGNIWIGTGNGINKVPAALPFERHGDMPFIVGKRRSRTVSAMAIDSRGNLWVGYGGGGCRRIDRITGDTTSFRYYGSDLFRVEENDITALLPDKEGSMWIGTRERGLAYWDEKARRMEWLGHDPKDPATLRYNGVISLCRIDSNTIAVGTIAGLDILDQRTGRVTHIESVLRQYSSVSSSGGQAFLFDASANLWMGRNRYNFRTHDWKEFRVDKSDSTALSVDNIVTVFRDSKDRVWFCTFGGGLHRYDEQHDLFQRFSVNEGMPSNVVYSIEEDDRGILWLGTRKGIVRFDPETRSIRTYTKEDGLIDDDFFWRSSVNDHRGHLYFGGLDGYIRFSPEDFESDTAAPRVTLTGMRVFENEYHLPSTADTVIPVTLEHTMNFFTLEFAALDFLPHAPGHFQYRLSAFEEQWHGSDETMTAHYTDVHPGSYAFEVRSRNRDGVWSAPQVLAAVTVVPAVWMTWWFKSVSILMICAALAGLYRYRLQQIEQMQNIRFRIAGDLHDEIGSNLSGIAIAAQMKALDERFTDDERNDFRAISNAAMQTAASMRDIVWFINPKHDTLGDLVVKMRETAHTLLGPIDIVFRADERFTAPLPLTTRRQVFLIFKETLTNIIRHAKASGVRIDIAGDDHHLVLTVTDDGLGFDAQEKSSGMGLSNMQLRARECGGTLTVSTGGTGTTVQLIVPIG